MYRKMQIEKDSGGGYCRDLHGSIKCKECGKFISHPRGYVYLFYELRCPNCLKHFLGNN